MADETEPTTEAMRTKVADLLYTFFRQAKPFAIRIVDREGKSRPLALKTGRKRWQLAARVVANQVEHVERVECLDAKSAIVDVWRVDGVGSPSAAPFDDAPEDEEEAAERDEDEAAAAAEEAEDKRDEERERDEAEDLEAAAAVTGKAITSADLATYAALLRLHDRAVARALRIQARQTEPFLKHIDSAVRMVSDRAGRLEKILGDTINTQIAAGRALAAAEAMAVSGKGEKDDETSPSDKANERMVFRMLARAMGMPDPYPDDGAPSTNGGGDGTHH